MIPRRFPEEECGPTNPAYGHRKTKTQLLVELISTVAESDVDAETKLKGIRQLVKLDPDGPTETAVKGPSETLKTGDEILKSCVRNNT